MREQLIALSARSTGRRSVTLPPRELRTLGPEVTALLDEHFGGTAWRADFQAAIDGKAAAVHGHSPGDLTQGGATTGQVLTWNGATWAPAAAASGGPTTVILGSTFATTSATAVDVTNFFFTPAANKTYLVEGHLLLETSINTVGPRPGFTWPGGMTNGASSLWVPNSATASAQAWGVDGTEDVAVSTGVPAANQSYLSRFTALLIMGASPTGNFQVRLRSETAGTQVRVMQGSFFEHRVIA